MVPQQKCIALLHFVVVVHPGPSGHLRVSDDLLEFVFVFAFVHVLLRRQVGRNLVRHDQVHL